MAQKRSNKKAISGWLVLNKPIERCQRKCEAVSRFGSATRKEQ